MAALVHTGKMHLTHSPSRAHPYSVVTISRHTKVAKTVKPCKNKPTTIVTDASSDSASDIEGDSATVAYRRNVQYEDFGCVPNGLERCAAVLRRLLAQQERGLTVPLFAWGRMTLTVKPLYCGDGQNVRPVELWKPKRHEIVAVMAYLYMGRTTDLNAQLGFTDVELLFEDDNAAGSGIRTRIRSSLSDFQQMQREINSHWGMHKRGLCPSVRKVEKAPVSSAAPVCRAQDYTLLPSSSQHHNNPRQRQQHYQYHQQHEHTIIRRDLSTPVETSFYGVNYDKFERSVPPRSDSSASTENSFSSAAPSSSLNHWTSESQASSGYIMTPPLTPPTSIPHMVSSSSAVWPQQQQQPTYDYPSDKFVYERGYTAHHHEHQYTLAVKQKTYYTPYPEHHQQPQQRYGASGMDVLAAVALGTHDYHHL